MAGQGGASRTQVDVAGLLLPLSVPVWFLIEPGPKSGKPPYAGVLAGGQVEPAEGWPKFAICPLWQSGGVENLGEKEGKAPCAHESRPRIFGG
jgi:hypothetical protein